MPVKIRLTRVGRKKKPSYRVVVMDSRKPRDGKYIEQIGRYDPRQEPSLVEINNERALDWLHKGAQPTERAQKLLEISGAWAQFRVDKGEIHTVGEHVVTVYPDRVAEASAEASAEAAESSVVEEVAAADEGEAGTEEVAEKVASSEEEAAAQAVDTAEATSKGSPEEVEDIAKTSAEETADVAEEENSEDA